jgi:hypothetical protein
MSYATATNWVGVGKSVIEGGCQIGNMIITKNAKEAAIKNEVEQAKKHYQCMAEIVASKEETSNQAKEIKLNALSGLEKLAEVEKDHSLAKERYTQAKLTKQRFKKNCGKLREKMARPFYGKPYRPYSA